MRKSSALIYVLWINLGLPSAFAQTSNPSQPANPVLHRAPAFASWTIDFSYKADERQPDPAVKAASSNKMDPIQSITVTKTNKTYWEQTVFKSGKKEEKWIFDGCQIRMVPGSNVIVPVSAPAPDSKDPNYSDYSRSDFDGLEWVSLENYKGVKNYQGKPAYLFESTKAGATLIALLSLETQLPLYSSNEETVRVYLYNPAPSAPLTPPAKFLGVLDTYKRGVGSLTRRTSPQ